MRQLGGAFGINLLTYFLEWRHLAEGTGVAADAVAFRQTFWLVALLFLLAAVPALGVRQYPAHWRLPLAYAVGVGGYAVGLALSLLYDLPSGALIVWCLAGWAVVAQLLAPRAGGVTSGPPD